MNGNSELSETRSATQIDRRDRTGPQSIFLDLKDALAVHAEAAAANTARAAATVAQAAGSAGPRFRIAIAQMTTLANRRNRQRDAYSYSHGPYISPHAWFVERSRGVAAARPGVGGFPQELRTNARDGDQSDADSTDCCWRCAGTTREERGLEGTSGH